MSLPRGLGSTYRLQLRPGWGFEEAAGVVPYLARLGVETLYCSPIAEAVPGSQHGYDGTDPTRVREELGGGAGYAALVAACEAAGLGICVDIVPNHLATWHGGPWWRRLLAEGRDSEMGAVFDVDWDAGGGKVVLPLLDRPLDAALGAGVVRVGEHDGQPVIVLGEDGGVDLPVAGGDAAPGDDAREVLEAQHYRLADWHDQHARNYRRFFDIDGLVGVRVEDPSVFDRTHALVVELAGEGSLSALRVDHVDGLRDPTAYLRRLADATDVPIVVEKILTGDERLLSSWPVVGTTGYEVTDDIGGVLVDPGGLDDLVAAGRADGDSEVTPLTVETRALVQRTSFAAETERAASSLGVEEPALADVLVRLPRYRTYLDGGEDDPADVAAWHAASGAEPLRRAVADTILDPANRAAALRVQQLTGALMAKGIEDTAWYRLSGPLAFCEVGGDPALDRHGAVERWHARASERVGASGLVPGTTHDTKRSQDVRCRLYALSERADAFEEGLARMRVELGLPEDGGEHAFETRVLAQSLLGVLPPLPARADESGGDGVLLERVQGALVKGAREAKWRSSWQQPDEGYEATLGHLAEALLADGAAMLRRAFGTLVDEVARSGAAGSLAAVVLRHAAPGVPDCYQGDEAWNLSLVDPDNRRPVAFAALSEQLERLGDPGALDEGGLARLRRAWRDGRLKLWLTQRCLLARRDLAPEALSVDGGYTPVHADGRRAGALLAFGRTPPAPSPSGGGSPRVLAVVTRRPGMLELTGDDLPFGSAYEGTSLALPGDAPKSFTDAICGHTVEAAGGVLQLDEVLATLPVALLVERP